IRCAPSCRSPSWPPSRPSTSPSSPSSSAAAASAPSSSPFRPTRSSARLRCRSGAPPRSRPPAAKSCPTSLAALLVRLRPGLPLADEASERATLQLQRIAAREGEITRIGLAVLGVVHLAGPFAGAGRLHAEHDLHADQRPAALARIGIVL